MGTVGTAKVVPVKAVALVVSARKKGNCYDFAQYILDILEKKGITTELINFFEYNISPCHCTYECLQSFDLEKKGNADCPIKDDVPLIWEKAWAADILFIFVPTYGGLPPAPWIAFTQRRQALKAPEPRKSVVSAVVLASPHCSEIPEFTPLIIAEEIKFMGKTIAGFEIINNAGYGTENLFGGLINEKEIQRRLEFLIDRTLTSIK